MINTVSDLKEYLKREKIGLSGGKLTHKGKRVGTLQCDGELIRSILIFTQFDSFFHELINGDFSDMKSIALPQITPNNCPRCIEGKCSVTNIKLSPDSIRKEEFAKKLLKLRCEAIENEGVPKCNYIKLSYRDKKPPCRKCGKCNPACRALKNY
ncbi:MAG: hypothetical protein GX061_00335 [Eubacteriaceae bacterium]|jgi:hypothetical protein|nr:hypothetical protein [Eubacteriaceae bacterium]